MEPDLITTTTVGTGNNMKRYRSARVTNLLEFLGIHPYGYCPHLSALPSGLS